MTTPRLGAPELTAGQAVPETTVNEQIRYLESGAGHFIFKDRDLATSPGSPADGDCYLVAAAPTGTWTGHAGDIAFRLNTAWVFIEAIEGFTAWVNDENAFIGYDGAAWNVLASPSGFYVPLAGGTMTGDLTVPAEVYGVGWNGSNEAPTKNDVYDKIETLVAGIVTVASTTEVLTGTDSSKVASPDAIAALWEQGADVASAGTVSLGEGGYFNITGTTTITDIDFGTDKAGRKAWVKFAGALTLTYNASTLILPTAATITTAAGDTACFVSEGSDVVRCVAYQRASGAALVSSSFTPNIQSVTSSATVTPTFANDQVNITAQAAGLTLANPTGTAVDAWGLVVRIKDNGTARTIAYGTQYRAIGVTLPTTTVISKTLYLGMAFNNADTKWDVFAVAQEA